VPVGAGWSRATSSYPLQAASGSSRRPARVIPSARWRVMRGMLMVLRL